MDNAVAVDAGVREAETLEARFNPVVDESHLSLLWVRGHTCGHA
jgi:hypothetical protein